MSHSNPTGARALVATATLAFALLPAVATYAQSDIPGSSATASATTPTPTTAAMATVSCVSTTPGRTQCAADTSAGVVLIKSVGRGECLLGKTWGYDGTGVWVSDGCSGEFLLGQATQPAATPDPEPKQPTERIETWGDFDPGQGFLIGRSSVGELAISGYALVRYINQLPADQTFTDHFGNEQPVDPRNDIYSHRVMVFLKGWLGTPKLIYTVILWTVNATDQDALFAVMGYQFNRKFSLYGGLNGLPGSRSLMGSHPFWLGHDRVMADEFFRPYFASGVWATGEPAPGLWYSAMVGNNSSALGVKATQLDRTMTTGGTVWWMPTTKEFGPRGGYGDWERHDKVATRFGISTSQSREERFTDSTTGGTGNTTLKLADGLNVFDPGALAPGVTVQRVDYRILSVDAGVKYQGIFLQTEFYTRWLDDFITDGVLPVASVVDQGFYVQGAFFPIPKKLELYAATSQIFGDKDAGFDSSTEYLGGMNFYPVDSRNYRFNVQVIDINRSPVGSTFGYYTVGQDGTTVSAAFSVFF